MKTNYVAIIAVLAALLLLGFVAVRGLAQREVVLMKNGIPLANLKGTLMFNLSDRLIPTSTDKDGRLDLSAVPRGAEQINVGFGDSPAMFISLPTCGKRVIDRRGTKTIVTTEYDFVFYRNREEWTWDFGDNKSVGEEAGGQSR